jgi:hypothetical protein
MTELPARFPIGADVSVTFNANTYLGGVVRGIQFTEGKVHYLVTLDDGKEITADSCDVEPAFRSERGPIVAPDGLVSGNNLTFR